MKRGVKGRFPYNKKPSPIQGNLLVELLKPMMVNLFYWEQFTIAESDFYPQQNVHLDNIIGGLVIGMDSDNQFRLIDLSGKGMGLFPVKIQLETLNDNIEVTNTLGKGTTFKILFDNYE